MFISAVLYFVCYFRAFGTVNSLSIRSGETLELANRVEILENLIINQQFNTLFDEHQTIVREKTIPRIANLIHEMESRIRALENKVNEQELIITELKKSEEDDEFLRKSLADLELTIIEYSHRFQKLETKVGNQKKAIANHRRNMFEDDEHGTSMDTHSNNSDIVNQELDTSSLKSAKNRIYHFTKGTANTGNNEFRISTPNTRRNGFHTQKHIQKRLLAAVPHTTITPVTSNTIAFYATMSSTSPSISVQYPLRFDVVKTNQGSAYHPTTGVFMVPESGIYVFTWTIRIAADDYHSTELVVNTESVGIVHLNSQKTTSEVTGIVVVHVDSGDDVFVRTYGSYNHGVITSDHAGRSSFAGWKLA